MVKPLNECVRQVNTPKTEHMPKMFIQHTKNDQIKKPPGPEPGHQPLKHLRVSFFSVVAITKLCVNLNIKEIGNRFIRMAHYTLNQFLRSAKKYLLTVNSMSVKKYISQSGKK